MDISSVNTDVFKVDESTSLQTRLTLEISRFLVTSLNLPFKFQIPPPNVRGQQAWRPALFFIGNIENCMKSIGNLL